MNEQQAMVGAVCDYLCYELKFKSAVPSIVRVFPPANITDYDRLYVEFESEFSADYVSSYARHIRKPDHQVSIYVPRGFQPRFRAFNLQARLMRTADGLSPGEVKTKVKYGTTDFCLLSKTRSSSWTIVNFDSGKFPPLDCSELP